MDVLLSTLHVLDAIYAYAWATFGVLLGLVLALEALDRAWLHRPAPRSAALP